MNTSRAGGSFSKDRFGSIGRIYGYANMSRDQDRLKSMKGSTFRGKNELSEVEVSLKEMKNFDDKFMRGP